MFKKRSCVKGRAVSRGLRRAAKYASFDTVLCLTALKGGEGDGECKDARRPSPWFFD